MTHVCCPGCGVRFSRGSAANLAVCPLCGEPPQPAPSAAHLMGYRLVADAAGPAYAQAVAVALPAPGPRARP